MKGRIYSGMRHLAWSGILALLLPTPVSRAILPFEVAVLINTNDASSVRVGELYAGERGIPDANIVRLGLPPEAVHRIGNKKFTEWIWEPATRQLEENGRTGHILAWVYSTGFPVAVGPEPDCSITGLTYIRNARPENEVIKNAGWINPLFAGPSSSQGLQGPSASFDHYKRHLGERFPLPSMMLGYTGPGGNTEEEVIRCLESSLRADMSQPSDHPVVFVTREDIRWRCREWELEGALEDLKGRGIPTHVGPRIPGKAKPLLGAFTGTQRFELDTVPGFVPGAIADHLTSFGGHFEQKFQMNISSWISKGASAAAGTVYEPYAIWAKFPHMRIYSHYAAGCSILESYYQSVRCPLQLLILGDPLCRPFSPTLRGTVKTFSENGERLGSIRDQEAPGDCYVKVYQAGIPVGRRESPKRFPLPSGGDVKVVLFLDGAVSHYTVLPVP